MEAIAQAKRAAAVTAVDRYVRSGQTVGLGTGSTANYAIIHLAEKVREKKLQDLLLVATSKQSTELALKHGLSLVSLDDVTELGRDPRVDVAIDGCDEVDSDLNLVKGRGGALLCEKLIETNAVTYVIIADDSKVVNCLGSGATPVEIISFAYKTTIQRMQNLPALKDQLDSCDLRRDSDGNIFVTDCGNYIVDLYFKGKKIQDAKDVEHQLLHLVGVVETGFFLGMRPKVIIGKQDGSFTELN